MCKKSLPGILFQSALYTIYCLWSQENATAAAAAVAAAAAAAAAATVHSIGFLLTSPGSSYIAAEIIDDY